MFSLHRLLGHGRRGSASAAFLLKFSQYPWKKSYTQSHKPLLDLCLNIPFLPTKCSSEYPIVRVILTTLLRDLMAKSDLFFHGTSQGGPQPLSQLLIFPTANLVPVCPRTLSAPERALQSKHVDIPRGYLQPLSELPISSAGL